MQILFWGSIFALAHTYILYPLLMRVLARHRQPNTLVYNREDTDWPMVSVLVSAYNEEKVIGEKLSSLRQLNYPKSRIQIYIGSDCSSDATNAIVQQAAIDWPELHFYPFTERRGKPPVINDLAAEALLQHTDKTLPHIFLLTDASVMLSPDALTNLVRHFKNPKIGAVDANMVTAGLKEAGISRSEDRYLSGEVFLKHCESLAWGMMIGPFGGCYAMRADLFEPVPPNSLVDDFWLVFRVLERGYQAINALDAVCYEGATHHVADEYRRKKRIAAGSFENLNRFKRWVLPPVTRLGFAFFSHKVLRWFGGFLVLIAWLSSFYLALNSSFYLLLCAAMTLGIVGIPLLYWFFERLNINIFILRSLYYFLAMNMALIQGFFQWMRGVQGSTWQRTNRT